MLIDCHIHAGELGKHYPEWWIKELYNAWGGIRQWAYGRENKLAGGQVSCIRWTRSAST